MTPPVYLSKVVSRTKCPQVARDLADCREMHRTVMAAFPDGQSSASANDARARLGVLFRVDAVNSTNTTILVQSGVQPDWQKLAEKYPGYLDNFAIKDISPAIARFAAGDRVIFRVLACPVTDDGNGKKIAILDRDQQLAWFRRKADELGVKLLTTTTSRDMPWRPRRGRSNITLNAALFEGVAEITDPATFASTIQRGLGRGKSFGLGMVSACRAR